MKKLILLAAFCLAFISTPSLAQEAVNLEDENARINYSVGYQVGGDFRRQGIELDPEVVAKGIEDALSGNKPLMTPVEMRKALTELQRQTNAKQPAPKEQAAEAQQQAGQAFLEANKTKEGVQVTASGLQYKAIREGSGRSPSGQDKVKVHYRGTQVDRFGVRQLLQAWDAHGISTRSGDKRLGRGLAAHEGGAKYELYISPDLAYGDQGQLANQTLIFEVDLISVENGE